MSVATAKLLSEFEALRLEDKQEFVREIIYRLPAWDSGPLSDDLAAATGDELALIHDSEERASYTGGGLAVRLRNARKGAARAHSEYSFC